MPLRSPTSLCALAAAGLLLGACSYSPPGCDDPALVKNVTDVINGNENVKSVGVTVKEVRAMKETAADADKNTRTCGGEVEMSNGQVMDLVIDLTQDSADQSQFVPTVRWTPRT